MSTNGSSAAIMGVVNKLYGKSTAASSSISARSDRGSSKISTWSGPSAQGAAAVVSGSDGGHYEYITNIVTQRYGLNGTYSVLIFLGEPASPDPATWATDGSLVGTYGIFAVAMPAGRALPSLSVTGAVPLTTKLLAKVNSGALASMLAQDVNGYLAKYLAWKVVRASDGSSVDPGAVPGLQVSVVSAQATAARNATSFPVWGQWGTVSAATHRKPAGLSHGQK